MSVAVGGRLFYAMGAAAAIHQPITKPVPAGFNGGHPTWDLAEVVQPGSLRRG